MTKSKTKTPPRVAEIVKAFPATRPDLECQRASFAYGNVKLEHDRVSLRDAETAAAKVAR